jgi:hypothetical protein
MDDLGSVAASGPSRVPAGLRTKLPTIGAMVPSALDGGGVDLYVWRRPHMVWPL